MSRDSIEFSHITLINDNIKNEVEENFNNKEKFQVELDRFKNKFNKLRSSTEDIIKKKNFNFKDFLRNDLNIQLSYSNNELNTKNNISENNSQNNHTNLINPSLKKINISNKVEIVNDREKDNIIFINNEKENNSYISFDKYINNLTISSIQDNSLLSNDNISNNNEQNLSLNKNNSNSSLNNNLFVVKIKNNRNNKKQLLGNKHNNKDKSKNKIINQKENLVSQIAILFNKIKNTADKFRNYFQIEEKNDNRTIFIENKKIFDIYLFKGKINRIYSYEKKIYSNKEKDIIEQLNIIQDNFEKKLISLGLNNNDFI